jgi:hypothetical protein
MWFDTQAPTQLHMGKAKSLLAFLQGNHKLQITRDSNLTVAHPTYSKIDFNHLSFLREYDKSVYLPMRIKSGFNKQCGCLFLVDDSDEAENTIETVLKTLLEDNMRWLLTKSFSAKDVERHALETYQWSDTPWLSAN